MLELKKKDFGWVWGLGLFVWGGGRNGWESATYVCDGGTPFFLIFFRARLLRRLKCPAFRDDAGQLGAAKGGVGGV